jgi:hypothetical protein
MFGISDDPIEDDPIENEIEAQLSSTILGVEWHECDCTSVGAVLNPDG